MEQEPKLENHAPERGLLDLSVALSTRDITAGNQFALFVLVRNPFNKPVWIRRVHVSLPSELKLADPGSLSKKQRRKQGLKRHEVAEEFERKLSEKDSLEKEKERLKAQRIKLQAKFDVLSQRLEEILSDSKSNPSDDVERRILRLETLIQNLKREIGYLTEQEYSSERIAFNMSGDPRIGTLRVDSRFGGDANISGDPKIGYLELYNSDQVQTETQTRTIELESSLPSYAALQSGSTAVYTALLSVRNSIIFTPSQYRLQFNVNYNFKSSKLEEAKKISQVQSDESITQEIIDRSEEEEELFTNTVPHEISIRPSVYSIMLGSVIGGGIGSLARALQINPSLNWRSFTSADFIVGISVSVILSAVAIVFMARKSDTQSFLSIEDFWGGLLIGFLIGYTGASFFQELTGITNPNQ